MTHFDLGPFRVLEPIATGGMAQVWRGVHREQGLPVAIKLVLGSQARNPAYRALFQNEVRAVAGLDHPHIIRVYDCGVVSEALAARTPQLLPDQPYLVMEYAAGGTLHRHPFPAGWQALKAVLLQVLSALAHAHARGVIHLDLKPANILLPGAEDVFGGLKLTDFGIAFLQRRSMPTDSQDRGFRSWTGTPRYMAPEQFSGDWRDYGPTTDLYTLGCIAYHFACGCDPFPNVDPIQAMWAHRRTPPPPLYPRMPVPAGLEAWIHTLMAKAAADRFACAGDAARALLLLDADPPAPHPSERSPARAPHIPDSWRPNQTAALDWALPERPAVHADTVPSHGLERPQPLADPAHAPHPSALQGVGLSLFHLRTLPVVDREPQRDLLWSLLRRVQSEGRAHLVVLEGASGTGKTRLAEWLAERALELGVAQVLTARNTPDRSPTEALTRMCVHTLRVDGLERPQVHERVVQELLRLGIENDYETEALTELLLPSAPAPQDAAAAPPSPPYAQADHVPDPSDTPPVVRFSSPDERFGVLRRHLERLAQERPILLCLEDVQWGSDTLAFASHLLRAWSLQPTPVLILLTTQTEMQTEAPDEAQQLNDLLLHPRSQTLTLEPLSPPDHSLLVQSLLALEPSLAAQVARRTQGSALFAVQLVGSWVQRGLLEQTERGFTLRKVESSTPSSTPSDSRPDPLPDPQPDPLPDALPESLHSVWQSRIQRLLESEPPGAQEALELAVALGQEVVQEEWLAVCREAGLIDPQPLLERLLLHRLAFRGREDTGRWRFVHGMLRETLARTAREAQRWKTHQLRCASLFARRPLPHTQETLDRLAFHYLGAEAFELALTPLLDAARIRFDRITHPEIDRLLNLWDQAVERLKLPAHDTRRGHGWLIRAHRQAMRGQFDAAVLSLRRLEHAALEFQWDRIHPEALLLRARIAQVRDDLPQAEEAVAAALPRFQGPDDRCKRAECLRLQGTCQRARGNPDAAVLLLQEAYALFGQAGALPDQAWCLSQLGRAEALRGRQTEALDCHTRAFAIHRSAGQLRGMANSLLATAELYLESAPAQAVILFNRSITLLERAEDVTGLARALNNLGEALRLLGRLDEAHHAYQRALKQYEAAGSPRSGGTRLNLATLELKQGQYDRAFQTLELAQRELSVLNEPLHDAPLLAARLLCSAGRGRWLEWDGLLPPLLERLSRHRLYTQDQWMLEEAAHLADRQRQTARAASLRHQLARLAESVQS